MKGDLHSVQILRRGDAPEASKDKLGRIPSDLQPKGFGRDFNAELGSFPTPPCPDSAERPAQAASSANSDITRAIGISQFMEEKSTIPSFNRIESISENRVPLRSGCGDKQTSVTRHTFWLHDQKQRTAVSSDRTRSDSGEAHENPWRPCEPSDDAKEWNGIEGLDGTPPGIDLESPATPR